MSLVTGNALVYLENFYEQRGKGEGRGGGANESLKENFRGLWKPKSEMFAFLSKFVFLPGLHVGVTMDNT